MTEYIQSQEKKYFNATSENFVMVPLMRFNNSKIFN